MFNINTSANWLLISKTWEIEMNRGFFFFNAFCYPLLTDKTEKMPLLTL